MYSKVRRLLYGLILLSGFLAFPIHSHGKPNDEGIRIDVPADGRVYIENKFGDVTAEVWDQSYVSVAASVVAEGTRLRRSPILIDNRGKYLGISVFRAPTDSATVAHLTVKVPGSSQLEIVTTTGKIRLVGTTSKVSVKSVSGDIETIIIAMGNLNINARSPRGLVKSTIPDAQPSDSHLLQARLGAGANQLDVQTESGQISFAYGAGVGISGRIEPGEPRLIGGNSARPASGSPSTASANQGDELSEGDVIRVDSQQVTVNMSVIDTSTNRGLAGLAQPDFKLFEDGEEQKLVGFEASSAPFDLVLAIDVSGSTKDKIKLMRSAALRFVNAARPADRIGIITFAGAPTVVSELTADREVLRERVNVIDTARGDTKLYDATLFAMDKFVNVGNKSRRTAIVLISDGLDGTIPGVSDQIGSQASYRETLDQIREFDGVVYTLWLNTRYLALSPRDTQPEAFDEAYDRMREMADAGGGIFYEVNRLEDLAGAYEKVVADLGTVYSLAYEPANKTRDGKWRAIRIRVNRPNAVARGKRGYYAK
ncbi:MAG TPA: VWA domain-containing protein [Pyrinomonadaceae bacterium]|nr:VWA domain-containing protein [Pyrinomonadaceae bacterium]